jgi:hypothetical protein
MCNLSAWLRAACLTFIALLAACNSDEVTFEPSMNLSGRVVADQPMTKSDVVGTWSVVDFENNMLMGITFSSSGELKYRLAQVDENGTPTPAAFARWRVIDNVLIIKWSDYAGKDECVSRAAEGSIILHCTTIGGVDDGNIAQYYFTPVHLASELPGTEWRINDDMLNVAFISDDEFVAQTRTSAWVGSWSAKDLLLTLKEDMTCEFAGGLIEYGWAFVCRPNGTQAEFFTWWERINQQ